MAASNEVVIKIKAKDEASAKISGIANKMGGRAGTMSMCIPFNVIEPVMGKLVSQGWLAYQRRSGEDDRSEALGRGIGATDVDITVFLAETEITMRELHTLQPGDIIQTTQPANAELIMQVRGKNKFAGRMGRHKDNLAIKITRRADVEESL